MHVEKVKFDQINNAGMEGVDHQWETTQCEWEKVSMIVVTLVSGTEGEKAHIVYKEGKGAIYGYFFIIDFVVCITFFPLQLFSWDCCVV